MARADLGSTMAAVATAPAGLGADDAARLLAPPPVEDVQFYSALTPRDSLPLLAVSGVTGKAFWIGSLPQPPDEEEETDDESDGEESEEEHELDAEGAAVQVRTSHFSLVLSAHDPRTREKPASTQISRPWPFFFLFFQPSFTRRAPSPSRRERTRRLSRRHVRSRSALTDLRFAISPSPEKQRSSRSRSFARASRRRRRCIACGRRRRSSGCSSRRSVGRRGESRRGAGAHGGAVRGAAGRASRVWEGVRRRRPDHQHQQAREHGLGDAGRRDRRARAQRGFAQDAVAAGLMRPGPEALWITYLDQTWHGALDAAGAIAFQDQTFYSPSAWAIHCKRLANPGKKADDGWKSVRYGLRRGADAARRETRVPRRRRERDPGSAGRAREGDGAKAQQTLGFARQELPVASAGESPASDRKRRTGLVSGVSSPDAAPELFLRRKKKATKDKKSRPARDAGEAPTRGRGRGELEHQSVKKPSAPSATDMSWLAAFADPADAEGAAERDARFAAAARGATTRRCSVAPAGVLAIRGDVARGARAARGAWRGRRERAVRHWGCRAGRRPGRSRKRTPVRAVGGRDGSSRLQTEKGFRLERVFVEPNRV